MILGGYFIMVFLVFAVAIEGLTPSTFISKIDQDRLRSIFLSARPYGTDLEALHYSILGLSLLGGPIEEPQKACDAVKAGINSQSIDSLFYATSAVKSLKESKLDCQLSVSGIQGILEAAIKEDSTTLIIYQAVAALSNLALKIDSAKVIAAVTGALKTDDSPLSHGYAFFASSYLSGDLSKVLSLVEDIIAQADELDEKYLQFEGGLHSTAVVVDGAYKLATAAKKAPLISEDKAIKLANYILSRKHVRTLKNAATLLSVVKTLTTNAYQNPVAVTLSSQVTVSDKSPIVQVRVSNLLGQSLGKLTVTADTARHISDDAVVLSKKTFVASTKDDSIYEIDLMSVKPAHGFYKIAISVVPPKPDAKLIGTTGAEVEVKVTTQITIENVELGVADREQTSAPKTTKIQYPNKAVTDLEADYHQRLMMKFQVKDKAAGATMLAHQTFVRLTNQKTKQEVIFIAESDNTGFYKLDLDIGAKAKDFSSLSGRYTLELIIGDAVIQNPVQWTVADIKLTFPEATTAPEPVVDQYAKKPEIHHIFREPEKRPPTVVSNLFTALVFVPFLIMLALWLKVGISLSGSFTTLSAIGFHLSLLVIFGLNYLYWTQLNMFETLKYLSIVAIPAFLFGNRLLSSIAAKRK